MTTVRSVRIEQWIWDGAKKALENDPDFDNISDFIRAMLYQLAKEEGERNRAVQAQNHSV